VQFLSDITGLMFTPRKVVSATDGQGDFPGVIMMLKNESFSTVDVIYSGPSSD
jgi:hypothetical protein